MIHATEQSLDTLEPLIKEIRKFDSLKEKTRGVFYHKSQAFLHFHEDVAGLFADVRNSGDWCRLPVNTDQEKVALVSNIARILKQI